MGAISAPCFVAITRQHLEISKRLENSCGPDFGFVGCFVDAQAVNQMKAQRRQGFALGPAMPGN